MIILLYVLIHYVILLPSTINKLVQAGDKNVAVRTCIVYVLIPLWPLFLVLYLLLQAGKWLWSLFANIDLPFKIADKFYVHDTQNR